MFLATSFMIEKYFMNIYLFLLITGYLGPLQSILTPLCYVHGLIVHSTPISGPLCLF